jgi:hypothetical protein
MVAIETKVKVYFQNLPGRTDENYKIPNSG